MHDSAQSPWVTDPVGTFSSAVFLPAFLIAWVAFAILFGPLGVLFGWMPAIPIAYLAPLLILLAVILAAFGITLAIIALVAWFFLYVTGLGKIFGL